MSKLNLLFVSIAFPSKKDSESLQVAKYFKYLIRSEKFNIDVVTSSNPTLFMPVDESLNHFAEGCRQLIEVKFFENKYLNYFWRKIFPWMISRPDSKYIFYKKWKWVAGEIKIKPDIIYSRSFPLSSTVMAYHLSVFFDVPWIVHLSDPWTESPVHSIQGAKKWNESMEEQCFRRASVISFTSLKTIKVYSEKYPGLMSKMAFFPNVYDTNDSKSRPWIKGKAIKIVYTGGLVGDRTPVAFINAMRKLNELRPDVAKDLEVVFAGSLDRINTEFFAEKNIGIKHVGCLSFSDALDLQNSADMLLLIDLHFENAKDAMFFPSKLLDYMLAKRRVIAITDEDSTTWQAVEDGLIGDCAQHSDIDLIMLLLVNAWSAWNANQSEYFELKNVNLAYSAELNAGKLSSELQRVYDEK